MLMICNHETVPHIKDTATSIFYKHNRDLCCTKIPLFIPTSKIFYKKESQIIRNSILDLKINNFRGPLSTIYLPANSRRYATSTFWLPACSCRFRKLTSNKIALQNIAQNLQFIFELLNLKIYDFRGPRIFTHFCVFYVGRTTHFT